MMSLRPEGRSPHGKAMTTRIMIEAMTQKVRGNGGEDGTTIVTIEEIIEGLRDSMTTTFQDEPLLERTDCDPQHPGDRDTTTTTTVAETTDPFVEAEAMLEATDTVTEIETVELIETHGIRGTNGPSKQEPFS